MIRCRSLLLCATSIVLMPNHMGGQTAAEPIESSPQISLTSPLEYQVFQRQTMTSGILEIRGAAHVRADRAEARVTGTSPNGPLPDNWVRMKLDKSSGAFEASLQEPAGGFYQLEIRLLKHHDQLSDITVPHVGIGEVFVIAGQSNSTNYGEVRQTTETGMVVAFDGAHWQIANDPQPGVQDHSTKGSFIPGFGDALYRKYRVPIGIAAVGHGSTSVRQWLPSNTPVQVMPTMTKFITHNDAGELVCDGTLFNGMMERIHELGPHGFRALLWHQGESDAHQSPAHQISPEQYRDMLAELIRASRKSAGWDFPWIVAEATYHTPDDPGSPEFEVAQQSLWREGVALEGPNTDTLGPDYRQNGGKGVHFSDAGLKAHGALWAESVERYIDALEPAA